MNVGSAATRLTSWRPVSPRTTSSGALPASRLHRSCNTLPVPVAWPNRHHAALHSRSALQSVLAPMSAEVDKLGGGCRVKCWPEGRLRVRTEPAAQVEAAWPKMVRLAATHAVQLWALLLSISLHRSFPMTALRRLGYLLHSRDNGPKAASEGM